MSQVNKPPLGLQAFLGSQNFGDNPSELASTLVPTLELFKFLSVYDLFTRIGSSSTITNDATLSATFSPPQGEFWLVRNVGVGIQFNTGATAAGEGANISAFLANTLNSNSTSATPIGEIVDFRAVDTSVSFNEFHVLQFPDPLPVRAGEVITFRAARVNLTGAADILVVPSVRFLKFKV